MAELCPDQPPSSIPSTPPTYPPLDPLPVSVLPGASRHRRALPHPKNYAHNLT